jgi:hypothetical protein
VWLFPDLYMNAPDLPGSEDYIKAARHPILSSKIIYGSAYPSQSLKDAYEGFLQARLNEECSHRVLRSNLLDFLGQP